MTEAIALMDPTSEITAPSRQLLPRLDSLLNKTVGLLDISKPKGKELLDVVEKRLVELGVTVKRYAKPTFARIAPTQLKQQIAVECDAVIEGLAD